MLNWLRRTSLRFKFGLLAGGCLVLASLLTAVLLPARPEPGDSHLAGFIRATIAACAISAGVFAIVSNRLMRSLRVLQRDLARLVSGGEAELAADPLGDREVRRLRSGFRTLARQTSQLRLDDEQARESLERRKRAVERLLEFSQTVQGVGRMQHVYATLAHFLKSELSLESVGILEQGEDADEPAQLVARRPEASPIQVGEFDATSCPCFRQALPRCFNDRACPARCGIETWLGIDADLPAFCVPITIASRRRAVVHMSRPADLPWDDESRQLAQAFINTAAAAMVSLDLLEEAEKRSLTDGLTGLFNRRSLEAMLRREVMLAQRHGQPLSLVMIDIDHFKPINDRHGHASGDFLLRTFAECLRSTLRRTDLAFRYGGDEFVVALPQTTIVQAQQVVQKVRQSFASADLSAGIAQLETRPTLSIGVATLDGESGLRTVQQLLEAADAAMYLAKSESRNAVRVYRRAA